MRERRAVRYWPHGHPRQRNQRPRRRIQRHPRQYYQRPRRRPRRRIQRHPRQCHQRPRRRIRRHPRQCHQRRRRRPRIQRHLPVNATNAHANASTTSAPTTQAPTPPPTPSGGNDANAKNLLACTGECESDGQCATGLTCFQRSSGEAIPGCTGNGGGNNWDYCYYTAEFQDRYADTVVSRIFYVYDRNDMSRIYLHGLRRYTPSVIHTWQQLAEHDDIKNPKTLSTDEYRAEYRTE